MLCLYHFYIFKLAENILFQGIIHDLTEKCWETCVDRPGPKMDYKTENCFRNCVQRFIDANLLATQRLERKAEQILQNHDSM